jgi:L-lactate dehydrogenase (cytochrome)|tara:strand:- start:4052 stop:5218 length:1167 start_codon:yes stop_codon:yes gene_type:complete
MNINNCHNFDDFRKLAKKKLPAPIFHYIDGGSDDEKTLKRNTNSFDECDLIPNVLTGVGKPDLSTKIFGRKIDMPIFLSPTAMQRLYHPEGDKASARAAEKFGTMYSMSTMANNTIEEIANISSGPKLFQLYIHKDKSITDDLVDRCRRANFDGLCLTVDTIVAGNRERDHRTGFTTPPKLTPESLMSFAMRPKWVFDYLTNKRFELANVKNKTDKGTNITKSVIEYINEQYDPGMNWKDAEYVVKRWNGPFALKGIMSVEDAKKAIDIGCTAILLSNHGGRQLDGSRSPFDQIKEISDAVGDKIEIILDGGVRRGTHVIKALAAGAKACSFGKAFLFSLSAGGQKGVEKLLNNMRNEIERNMMLMGCKKINDLDRSKIIFRKKRQKL